MHTSGWGEFMVGIAVTAVALLALNAIASERQPLLRLMLAVVVGVVVVLVLRSAASD